MTEERTPYDTPARSAGPSIDKTRRDWDTSTMGPVCELPTGMLTRRELAKLVRELPVGAKLTVERLSERRVRITKGDTPPAPSPPHQPL